MSNVPDTVAGPQGAAAQASVSPPAEAPPTPAAPAAPPTPAPPTPAPPTPAPPTPAPPTPAAPAAPPAPAAKPRASHPELRIAGISLMLLALFLGGFAVYLFGLSGVAQKRDQTRLYSQLRNELSLAIAPTGATKPGDPVAILDFPSLGVQDMVVVEGTTPENLMLGPGLVRDSPLPGQAGVSQIYGRVVTFGGPFSILTRLRRGDLIKATTSQGVATYKVAALGSSAEQVSDPAPNRLILLTAGSSFVPTYYSYVDADLVSTAQAEPGGLPPIYSDELPLKGDDGALVITLLWALALAGVSVGATFAAARWAPWPAYLSAAPIVIVVAWNLYRALAAVLPNVY